jgi:branched-chain amino acid transport system permease protein
MAGSLGPIVFVVVVVGGLGSLAGAFVASLFIGILQTFAVAVDYSIVKGITVSQVAPVLPYLIMVAILIARPRGLLGTRES